MKNLLGMMMLFMSAALGSFPRKLSLQFPWKKKVSRTIGKPIKYIVFSWIYKAFEANCRAARTCRHAQGCCKVDHGYIKLGIEE